MNPETIPAIPLPPPDYWTTYGFLGVCAGIGVVCVVIWFVTVKLPHMRAKQRIELSREEKNLALSDTLRDALPIMASTQQRLVEVAERMEDRQGPHAEECKRTLAKVEVLTERVDSIAGHLRIGGA